MYNIIVFSFIHKEQTIDQPGWRQQRSQFLEAGAALKNRVELQNKFYNRK